MPSQCAWENVALKVKSFGSSGWIQPSVVFGEMPNVFRSPPKADDVVCHLVVGQVASSFMGLMEDLGRGPVGVDTVILFT